MSTNEIGIEQARKELGPRADAAHHRGEITYLTRYGRRYAAIVPIDHIKEPAMAITFRRTRDENPDGWGDDWGDDVITITQDGGQVVEKFHVDGIDDTNHSWFSDEDEAAEYIRRRGIELESDGYRRD